MYNFFQDPGHGWLEVRLSEICDLNIEDNISTFSYYSSPYVYLEEDCDLTIFLKAMGLSIHGEETVRWWRNNVVNRHEESKSFIRDLDRYVNKAPLATRDRAKPQAQWTRKRWFVGYKRPGDLDVFPCYYVPTEETHKPPYGFVDGPYRTKKAAIERGLSLGGRR